MTNQFYITLAAYDKELFDKVRKDELSAKEVFNIKNIEQRRIAYQRMDKLKMKELDNFKILDQAKDKYGNNMKIIEFTIDGFDKPFRYYNCICPSTQREYFVECFSSTKCNEAKSKSFGMDEDFEFDEEY